MIKKFSIEESAIIFNLNNNVYFDDNGNLQVTDDNDKILFNFTHTKPLDGKLKNNYLVQNIYDVTKATKTKGLINNDPKDTNPILSPNNKWILYRDINTDVSKQYKPIYNIQETLENNNIFLYILYFSLIIGIIYIIFKK
jgi:hypothetical protein